MSSSSRVEDGRLIPSSRCKDVMVSQPMSVTMCLAVRPEHRWILHVSGRIIPQQHTSHIYISKALHRLMWSVLVAEVHTSTFTAWKTKAALIICLLSPPRESPAGHPRLHLLPVHTISLWLLSSDFAPLAWCERHVASRQLTPVLYLLFFPSNVISTFYRS